MKVASNPNDRTWRSGLLVDLLIFSLVVVVAGYLRFTNLHSNPGWYSDEGTIIDISQHMLEGRSQYMAINQSTLLVARFPLYPYLLTGIISLLGDGIMALRILSASLGTASVGLTYVVIRKALGWNGLRLAALSALILAIYPQAILYNRLGFSYNLHVPFVLLMLLGLWEFMRGGRSGWLALAAVAGGLGTVSDLSMFIFILPLALGASSRRWRDLLWSLPLYLAPFGVYAIVELASVPTAFLFDLNFTLSRLNPAPLLAQLPVMLLNYVFLLGRDIWFVAAIIGIFVLEPNRWRWLILAMFLIPLFSLFRGAAFSNILGYYLLIPLLPFVAIGVANLILHGAPRVAHTIREALSALLRAWNWRPAHPAGVWLLARARAFVISMGIFVILISPFLFSTIETLRQIRSGYPSVLDPVLVSPGEAREIATFVNGVVEPEDLVIASPAIGWLIDAQVADFQIALAAEGIVTRHLPGNIPSERFAFDPRLKRARFVIIDRIWRNWAAPNMPEVAAMVETVERWPLAFRVGEISVYENPLGMADH